jgi:hypothetical protein
MATLRTGVLPRLAAVVLIIGAILTVLPILRRTDVVLVVGVSWLGLALFTGSGTTALQPSRVS